jgi:hypothetical protein
MARRDRVTPNSLIGSLEVLAQIVALPDDAMERSVALADGKRASVHFVLYDCLRREQSLLVGAGAQKQLEIGRILDLAQAAYGQLVGLLVGRDDALLDTARDGEWSLRDLLRHAIAVELRYAAQVLWGASRRDDEPLAIPNERLPCDRLDPPEPAFADARARGNARMLELLGQARASSDEQLARIPDPALDRPTLWGQRQLPVRMRAHQMAAHLTEVIVQAEKCLFPFGPQGEARRILRHCCAMRGAHERWSADNPRAAIDDDYRRVLSTVLGGS